MKNNNLVINSWFGRTGNNIISIINALFIAVFYNYNLSFPKHSLFNTTIITFDSCNTNVKNHDDTNNFFYKQKLKNIDKYLFNDNLIKIKVYELMKSILINSIKVPYKSNNDLVIHIRSGDIFSKNVYHTSYYLSPPFDYYDTILSNNNFDNIYIIAEDDKNPIIKKLCNKYSNIKFRLNSLVNDIKLLLSVSNVIFSVGTFLNLLIFSENIKTIYLPKYNLNNLNVNRSKIDTEIFHLYTYNIYFITMFNLDIKTKYINLEDYPEKMFKSQNKINFLLNYTKYKIDNTFELKQLLNDIINDIEELKKNNKKVAIL